MKIDKVEIATGPLLTAFTAVSTVLAIRDCATESDSVTLKITAIVAASLVGAFALKLLNKDGSSGRSSRPSTGSTSGPDNNRARN